MAWRRLRKPLVHAFVLFHLGVAALWSFTPVGSAGPLEAALRRRVAPYVNAVGLWQSWVMFAPNPATANVYVDAEVTFADGSRATWTFPRMDRMGYFERFRKERYRKWTTERVCWMGGRPDPRLSKAAAAFAVRQVPRRADSPPVKIELVRHAASVPPPRSRRLPRYAPEPSAASRELIFIGELDASGNVTRVLDLPTTQSAEVGPAAGNDGPAEKPQ